MRDTIDMAREAWGEHHEIFWFEDDGIEKFAAIVRADAIAEERAALMQLFTDPENQPTQHGTVTVEYMQREVAAEREACAKAVENYALGYAEPTWAFKLTDIIRARGEASKRGETK